jgi:hypothetical protein
MVRSLNAINFKAPWPFVKKGSMGWRKIGPMVYEKHKYPGQNREFAEISPKFQQINDPKSRGYTGVQNIGYTDPTTGKFVRVKEMIPELVVPSLEGFPLKPYVSFQADVEIERRRVAFEKQVTKHGSEELADKHTNEEDRWPPAEMTPKTLFQLFYADKVCQAFKEQQAQL